MRFFSALFHSAGSVFCLALMAGMLLTACSQGPAEDSENSASAGKSRKVIIIPGEDEPLAPELIQRGEVLISYSDCYDCHRKESEGKGPSFSDIARRYPRNPVYIDLLARKVISGGFGTWGYPIMSAHPKLPKEDAQAMVAYVLSFDKR
ncbi:c-type cytochrome [Echinicola pacifica]|nr:c-type cytochrome [Echinicola pacifica]